MVRNARQIDHKFNIFLKSFSASNYSQNVITNQTTVFKKAYNIFASHYNDVIMGTMASQITSPRIVYLAIYSGADQRKHQSFASLAFVRGIHRGPVNSPHKWPVTQKMFPFDDFIMLLHMVTVTDVTRNGQSEDMNHSYSNGTEKLDLLGSSLTHCSLVLSIVNPDLSQH